MTASKKLPFYDKQDSNTMKILLSVHKIPLPTVIVPVTENVSVQFASEAVHSPSAYHEVLFLLNLTVHSIALKL
jgi:hypothetical protein